ncbi:MAG TPA: hypothetical protein VHF69_14595 [Candidatus Synoicihabitans sp.]|nr:hypothetical protein [Candidatus Synoicihabitans sp.]
MDSADRIEVVKDYLRRKFRNDIPGLKALMESVATGALGTTVTIIGSTFEGGSANGVVTFERLEYLAAIMAVLDELDPADAPEQPTNVRHADFSYSQLET